MAKKEKKVDNEKVVKEKGNKKKRPLLWIGLSILALGLLIGGGAFALGLLTLARDIAFTAIGLDVIGLSVVGGKLAVDAIANKTKGKDKTKELNRERTRNQEKTKEEEFEMEPLPVNEGEKVEVETFSRDSQTKGTSQKRTNSKR